MFEKLILKLNPANKQETNTSKIISFKVIITCTFILIVF